MSGRQLEVLEAQIIVIVYRNVLNGNVSLCQLQCAVSLMIVNAVLGSSSVTDCTYVCMYAHTYHCEHCTLVMYMCRFLSFLLLIVPVFLQMNTSVMHPSGALLLESAEQFMRGPSTARTGLRTPALASECYCEECTYAVLLITVGHILLDTFVADPSVLTIEVSFAYCISEYFVLTSTLAVGNVHCREVSLIQPVLSITNGLDCDSDSWYDAKVIPVLDKGNVKLKARVARHEIIHFSFAKCE